MLTSGPMLGYDAGFGATAKSPAVATLQRALAALAAVTRDKSIAVPADGVAGPKTAAAVNRAFTVHIGSGQAPATFRTGKLSAANIKNQAGVLATYVATEAKRRGGSAPAGSTSSSSYLKEMEEQIKKRVPGAQTTYVPGSAPATAKPLTAQQKAEIQQGAQARSGAGYFSTAPGTVLGLQQSLNKLSTAVRDKSIAVKADGKIGPKTVAATNRALSVHVGPGQAAAQYRTGRLTQAQIMSSLVTFATLVNNEAVRRLEQQYNTGAGHFGPGSSAASSAPKPSKANAPTKSVGPAKVKAGRSAPLALLQTRLSQLGRLTGDTALVLTVDGITGPKTAAATNRAMTKYVKNAPATYKTGKLSAAAVRLAAPSLAQLIAAEVSSRGSTPAATPPEDAPAMESGGGSSEPVSYETAPPDDGGGSGGESDDSGGGAAASAPAYRPSSAPSRPSGGGSMAPTPSYEPEPSGGGGEAASSSLEPAPAEPKAFPWLPVAIGLGAVGLIATIVLMKGGDSNKNQGPSQNRHYDQQPRYAQQRRVA